MLKVGGEEMVDKETMKTLEEIDGLLNPKRATNGNIAADATTVNSVSEGTLDNRVTDERHNDNARAAAAMEQENPRINTDNL
ncbi:hypothetical protein [Radiobacillus sp. PE A8.2]|uniref:hypothetical protein n=1 Tax=Radiobacillus sp. PE A8.2 TaxID=3380349 RepID=UPI00388EFF59